MRPLHSLIPTAINGIHKVTITHCNAIKSGKISDTYTSNTIVNSYTKCRDLPSAHNLFDEMAIRDSVSWNMMIAAYVNNGKFETGFQFVKCMRFCGFNGDVYTFGSILKGIGGICRVDVGEQVHSMIVKMGYEQNVYSGSALLDMYAKCKRVEDAFAVFQCMPERNSVSWNALIYGYAQLGDVRTVFWLLGCMEWEGLRVDDATFAPILTLLDSHDFYKLVMQVHAKIVKLGLESESTIHNASITAYSECGSITDAKKVFDGVSETRNVVTWNSMIAAYSAHDLGDLALRLFLQMQEIGFRPDIYTYTSVISGCCEGAHLSRGKSLHGLVVKRGLQHLVPISNSLIAMYLKSDSLTMKEALSVFESMERRDQVSWNSISTGFSQHSLGEQALKFFKYMKSQLVALDHYTFSAALRSCSDLATLQLGQQVHVLTLKSGLHSNDHVASSLIFMYSTCGILEDAKRSFEETPQESAITWNSMLFGYAQHGEGNMALKLFHLMRKNKVRPDHITFVAVLTACSHTGLLEEGCNFLKSMESEYGFPPRMEHYACAIDLCGRARRLDKAKAIVESMPFRPGLMVWQTLLGACRTCGDIELANKVANYLLEIDPRGHCAYVLLSGTYGHLERWDEKASVDRLMRDRGVKKVPGWSWIEVGNKVHAFNARDHSHPHCVEIYQMLDEVMEEMTSLDAMAGLEISKQTFVHDDEYFNEVDETGIVFDNLALQKSAKNTIVR